MLSWEALIGRVDNQIDYNHLIEFRYSHCKVKHTQEQINLYKIMYKRAILLKILSFKILFEVAMKIGGDVWRMREGEREREIRERAQIQLDDQLKR